MFEENRVSGASALDGVEEVVGMLIIGDMAIKIRIPAWSLVCDAIGWAEQMVQQAEAEVLQCVTEQDFVSARTEGRLAETLKKWLENPAQKIIYPACLAWTERIHSPLPLCATVDNWESYVRCFMGLGTEAGADEPVDFVFACDFLKPILVANQRLKAVLENCGEYVTPVTIRGANI